MDFFKTNRGKPGILYDGFRFRKDRDSKTVHLWRCVKQTCTSNTSNWPRKSCENIGASVTPKLGANAPLLCAQVYDRRKRNFCKMSANVIAPPKVENLLTPAQIDTYVIHNTSFVTRTKIYIKKQIQRLYLGKFLIADSIHR